MSNDFSIAEIPLLSSQAQYIDWALEIEATAMIGGFHAPLVGENTTNSTDATELDKISQREQKAKGLILKTISQELRKELVALRVSTSSSSTPVPANAENMWNYLKSRFKKKTGTMLLMDFKRFLRSDLVDDGTLEAQLNKLTDIRFICALNDFEVQDWQFASIILLALPERYRNIADSLLPANDIKRLSIDHVKAKILDQEARHKDSPPFVGKTTGRVNPHPRRY